MAKVPLKAILKECKRRRISFADERAEAVKIIKSANLFIENVILRIDSKTFSNEVHKAGADGDLARLKKVLVEARFAINNLLRKV